jgi:hypothetical protein
MFPDPSLELFPKAKRALKNDLRFARRRAVWIDGFIDEKDGRKIPGLGVGVGLLHVPGVKKMCVDVIRVQM